MMALKFLGCSMKNRTVNNDKSNLKGKKFKTFDMRKDEHVSKDLINGRDSSLFLFRALGKILYCKSMLIIQLLVIFLCKIYIHEIFSFTFN